MMNKILSGIVSRFEALENQVEAQFLAEEIYYQQIQEEKRSKAQWQKERSLKGGIQQMFTGLHPSGKPPLPIAQWLALPPSKQCPKKELQSKNFWKNLIPELKKPEC